MFTKSRLLKLLVLLALGLFVVACAPTAAPAGESGAAEEGAAEEVATDVTTEEDVSTGMSADATPYINLCEGDPVDGGSITLAIADDAMVGRNWLSRGSTNESFIFSQLTDLSIEDAETIEPDVATDWAVSEDGLTYTYNLRDDVLWHDGEQLTSADVKYTIEIFAHPDSGATVRSVLPLDAIVGYDEFSAGEADEISGVTTPSDFQVVITLKSPRADFLYGMGGMNLRPSTSGKGSPLPICKHHLSPASRWSVPDPSRWGNLSPINTTSSTPLMSTTRVDRISIS